MTDITLDDPGTSNLKVVQEGDKIFFVSGDKRTDPFPANPEEFGTKNLSVVAKKLGTTLEEVRKAHTAFLRRSQPQSGQAADVGDLFHYAGDRGFRGRVQVVALGFPESRFTSLMFRCEGEGDSEKCVACPLQAYRLEIDGDVFDPSVFATYFDSNDPRSALFVLMERGLKPMCGFWHKGGLRVEGQNERAVTRGKIMDRASIQGRVWFVHNPKCDLKSQPNWIIASGYLCHGARGRVGVLVKEFQPESEVSKPTEEEIIEARKVLQGYVDPDPSRLEHSVAWRVASVLRKRAGLKGDEVVKGFVSDLLTIASPVWVKTPEGESTLGATTCELGPTTTAKSQRWREIVTWLEAGHNDTGRKTPAGLTAGLEKIEGIGWVVSKGLLPSWDLSFLAIDNMPPHAIDEQIESRRNGLVRITGIKNAELWARCRVKLLSNPLTPLDEHMQKCVALRVFDPKLIARMAFAVFTYGVSTEERYNPAIETLTAEDSDLLSAVKVVLRANLSEEITYTVAPEHWPRIMELSKDLEIRYGTEDVPLLVRSVPYKVAVVAFSFALLEGFETPEERYIKLAHAFLDYAARDIELDEYAEQWRKQHSLGETEYQVLSTQLGMLLEKEITDHGGAVEDCTLYKLIEYVAKNEKAQCEEIAACADDDPRTVKRRVRDLKGLGLIRSDKDGYHFTARGVRFFKRWFKERSLGDSRVPDVPDDTTSEGHTLSHQSKPVDTYVTPESGDNEDIEDTRGGSRGAG